MKPIVHLLCKSLPQRCQIRNLREIIANYCQTDDMVYIFLKMALVSSLLGNYQHAKKRPAWKARYDLIRRFIYKPPNRNQMQEWIFTYYQNLLFYVIKEFGIWDAFDHTIVRRDQEDVQMGDFLRITYRKQWIKCVRRWKRIAKTVLGFPNGLKKSKAFLSMSTNINWATCTVLSAKPLHRSCCSTERIDEARSEVEIRKEFPVEYKKIMRQMAKSLERRNDVPIPWLQYFGVSQKTIDVFVNMQRHYHQNTFRTELKKRLASLTRYEFEAIRDLFDTFLQTHHEIRIFPLPKHLYVKQVKALRRRYGIRNGVSLPDHVGKVYICTTCNTFKGFVVKKGSDANLFANGHHKVLIDDESLNAIAVDVRKRQTLKNAKMS